MPPDPPPPAIDQHVQPTAVGVRTPLPGTAVVNSPVAPQTLVTLVQANPLAQSVVTQALNQSLEMAMVLSNLKTLSDAMATQSAALAAQGAQILALSIPIQPPLV